MANLNALLKGYTKYHMLETLKPTKNISGETEYTKEYLFFVLSEYESNFLPWEFLLVDALNIPKHIITKNAKGEILSVKGVDVISTGYVSSLNADKVNELTPAGAVVPNHIKVAYGKINKKDNALNVLDVTNSEGTQLGLVDFLIAIEELQNKTTESNTSILDELSDEELTRLLTEKRQEQYQ